jgi:hypothetical protein
VKTEVLSLYMNYHSYAGSWEYPQQDLKHDAPNPCMPEGRGNMISS